MFSSILSSLQTLISPRFIVANFSPALAFWFINALTLFLLNGSFQVFAHDALNQTLPFSAVLVTAVMVGVAISAYFLSALLPAIQSLMEGNWPSRVSSFFVPAQMTHFERLGDRIAENSRLRGGLGTTSTGETQAQRWQESLTIALEQGTAIAGTNNYTFRNASARAVERLADRRRHSRAIPANDINAAVVDLVFDLRANNTDRPGPDNDFALEKTRARLWELIEYDEQFALTEYRLLINKCRFTFGALPLAPTAMGNIAKTIQSYAVERYDLNFEFFWSRLQPIVQKDAQFGPILQSAKTQLDFLISSSFLTFVWTALWGPWLFLTSGPQWLFLGVTLLGPLLSWTWYRIAVAHYRVFADVLRTAVDLFRFDLLTALRIPLPTGVQDEYVLWEKLDAVHSLNERNDLRYIHPRSTS